MGNDKEQRKSLGFSFFKKNKVKKNEEHDTQASRSSMNTGSSPPSYSASVSTPVTVFEKPLPPHVSPTINTPPLTIEQRLVNIKKRVAEVNKGTTILIGQRNPTEFHMQVNIDGKNPKTVPALQNITDELPYQHPSFKLMTAGNVVKTSTFQHPDQDWSEIDPEIIDHYQGQVPGTLSLSAFNQDINWAIKTSQVELRITLWLSPDLPPLQIPELVEKMSSRKLFGLSSSEVDCYNDLIKLVGPGAFVLSDPNSQYQLKTQCLSIINLLNNSDYWDNLAARSTLSGPMTASPNATANFIYVLLLATELRLRIPRIPDPSFTALREKIKADMILSKRWQDHIEIKMNPRSPANFTWNSLIQEQQIAGLIRFAELMDWPYLNTARPKIEYAYRNLQSGNSANSHVWDWLFGLCLPGKYYSFKAMTTLIHFTTQTYDLGPAPYYDSGLMLTEKTYWRLTTVLGRVLGATSGTKACMNWVGPCPAVIKGFHGLKPQWIKVNARQVPPEDLTGFDADLDDVDDIVPQISDYATPEEINEVLQSFELASNWIAPTPPQPLIRPGEKDKFEVVGIELQKNPVPSDIQNPEPADMTYQASILMKIHGAFVTYNLHSNPLFLCSHPCLGTHKVHKNKIPVVQGNIVSASNLKGINSWNGILVINTRGSNNAEVAARAWCAERGYHALIKHQKTCFKCGWEQARQIHLKVFIYR
jgi:hypothetical protein